MGSPGTPISSALMLYSITHLAQDTAQRRQLKDMWLAAISDEEKGLDTPLRRQFAAAAQAIDRMDITEAGNILMIAPTTAKKQNKRTKSKEVSLPPYVVEQGKPRSGKSSWERVRGALGLSHRSPEVIVEAIVGTGEYLQFATFHECIVRLLNQSIYMRVSDELRGSHQMLCRAIYNACCSCTETELATSRSLAIAASLFCGGTMVEKTRAAFVLFDANGDGRIELQEMVEYMLIVFVTLDCVVSELIFETGVGAFDLAMATAEMSFRAADTDSDGFVSWEEFVHWFESSMVAGISF